MQVKGHEPLNRGINLLKVGLVGHHSIGGSKRWDEVGLLQITMSCCIFMCNKPLTITYAVRTPPLATCGVTSSHIFPCLTWTWKLKRKNWWCTIRDKALLTQQEWKGRFLVALLRYISMFEKEKGIQETTKRCF